MQREERRAPRGRSAADLRIFVKPMGSGWKRVEMKLRPWASVEDLKAKCAAELLKGAPAEGVRLFFRGQELSHRSRTLRECGVRAGAQLHVAMDSSATDPHAQGAMSLHALDEASGPASGGSRALPALLSAARKGIESGLSPVLALDGTGGTYFLRDASKKFVACFKPADEEPFCRNNPKGFVSGAAMRAGVRPGEAHYREVAAFLADGGGWFGVPPTGLVEARHTAFRNGGPPQRKAGSLQAFVPHDEVVGDMCPHSLPAAEVHRIAVLDILLCNTDRNDANLLVVHAHKAKVPRGGRLPHAASLEAEHSSSGEDSPPPPPKTARAASEGPPTPPRRRDYARARLVPIDHGYCLPERLEVGWCDWVWLEWPQLKAPLAPEDRRRVLELDPFALAARLRAALPLRESALRNMVAAGLLLREGVRCGLSLYDIANIVARQDLDEPSELEAILERARAMGATAVRELRGGARAPLRRIREEQAEQERAPAQRHGRASSDDHITQLTKDVVELCQGLPSPATRTKERRRSSLEAPPPPALLEEAEEEALSSSPLKGYPIVRVASFGGFNTDWARLAEDQDAEAAQPSPEGRRTLSKRASVAGEAHHAGLEALCAAAANAAGAAAPGAMLARTQSVHADLAEMEPGAAAPRAPPVPPKTQTPPPGAVDPLAERSESQDGERFFFGAVEMHVRALVQRKLRLREEERQRKQQQQQQQQPQQQQQQQPLPQPQPQPQPQQGCSTEQAPIPLAAPGLLQSQLLWSAR